MVKALRVRLTELDEDVASRVREVDELAVALLGFVTAGGVVGPESIHDLGEELGLVRGEQVELTLYEIGEPARHGPRVDPAVALLVRTWNVFHGRTVPAGPALELERMIRLVTDDRPAVVGLQEVPLWAVGRLGGWSGMRTSAAVAMPALGGPFARRLTDLDPHRLRSSLVGQANVVLLGEPLLPAGGQRIVRLNPPSLRRAHRVSPRERVDWARNRRVAQFVAADGAGPSFHVVNLHASKGANLARAELGRLEQLLPAGPIILLGDLNVGRTTLPGFSPAIAGIDQILVRGLELERPPATWPAERRRHGDLLLSDHAPVEALVSVGSPAL